MNKKMDYLKEVHFESFIYHSQPLLMHVSLHDIHYKLFANHLMHYKLLHLFHLQELVYHYCILEEAIPE